MKSNNGLRISFLLVFVSILLLALSVVSSAATLEVTKDDSGLNLIQEAVKRAEPGDTVLVKSGHYVENISIDKDLTLQARTPGKVRIDGTVDGRPTLRIGPSEISVTVIGISVEGAEGGICNDRARGVCPDGLSAAGKSSVEVENSSFESNGKNGIRLVGSSRVEIENSKIKGNRRAGFWITESAEATVRNIRISNNRNGLYLDRSARIVLSDSDILSNSGYGINLFGESRIILESSQVKENGKGGLKFENTSRGIVRNTSIKANDGQGVLIQSSAKVTMEGNEVKGNAVGITSHTDESVTFANNDIFKNSIDLVGGLSGNLRKKLNPENTREITLPNEDYSGFQAAVDALERGGTIYLDGEVTGHAVIDKKMRLEAKEVRAQLASQGDTIAPLLSLVKNAKVEIEGISVGGSGGTGVVLASNARLIASKSTFEDNSEEGIGLWNSAELHLKHSAVKKNGGSGLRLVDSAQLEVRASNISGNKVANVLLAGSSSGDVESSKITASEGNGFSIDDLARLSVKESEISGNESNGLKLTASGSGSVVNCGLSDNEEDGIALYSSSRAHVADSKMTKNVNGISLREASVLVSERNSFKGNRNGIKVMDPEKFRGEIRGTKNAFSENDSDFSGVKESIKQELTE
ncbi:right-handed parallel beta-helix repeat-containing protein [Candidatus Bipolaricaulota bacterium]|nr:right-handed parallel beta-helix repeat-containing protein [Candidatus Bipolaricaulota bacterium]